MMKKLPSFDEAQKAISVGKAPKAFLHLGMMYAQGIGVTQDHILSHYFIKKALDMGCNEAEEYLNIEYESGNKDFAADIESYIGEYGSIPRETIVKLKARVEVERKAKHYGNLSKIRKHLALIYPEYNREKAIDDILNGRESIDADVLYSTSTTDNTSEICLELQDRLLQQLYVQVENDDDVWEYINTDVLGKDEKELAQTLVNFTSSYDKVCKTYHVDKKEIYNLDTIELYPYIKVQTLATLRRQGFRALLSIKDVEPIIRYKFLQCLDSDEKLLNVCEEVKNQDLQLFLISFVELNIDIESLEFNSLALLKAYRNNNLTPIVEHINAFVDRLNKVGIKNHLPLYTLEDLPLIDLSKDDDSHSERPLSNEVGVKGRYSILKNENGEIMVMIDTREGEPDDPRLIYDGKMALLFRNFDSNVLFRNIDPEAHEALQEVNEVLVIEVLNDDVEREYIAPLRRVKDVGDLIA